MKAERRILLVTAMVLAVPAGATGAPGEPVATLAQTDIAAPAKPEQSDGPEGFENPLSLRLASDRDSARRAGETVHFGLVLSNKGAGELRDIMVEGGSSPPVCARSGGPVVALLPPGGEERCTGVHVVSQADLDGGARGGGMLDIVFSAHSDGVVAQVHATVELDLRPSLKLARSASFTNDSGTPGAGDRGDTVAHVYIVTNSGNVTIDDVFVSDRSNGAGQMSAIARETMIHDVPPEGDSVDRDSNDGKWSRLAPGDTVLFAATYAVTQADMDRQAGAVGAEDESGKDDRDTMR